jgi:hypothetical protein
MRLHKDKALFRQAIIATAQAMDIPETYIEKDYWVTYALKAIFSDPIGAEAVFKGGTALSKCFGIIDRFSEAIDLVVMRSDSDSGNQLKEKLKRIGAAVSLLLPEIEVEGLTRRMGMNRKTAHRYPNLFVGSPGQVRGSFIVVEANWLGSFEPYTTRRLNAYVSDMMIGRGQQSLVEKWDLASFEVNALRPERTFCEKIMSLVRFSYSEQPIDDLKLKIRHTYDLHKLLDDTQLKAFFESEDFEPLLLSVAKNDVVSYKNNNAWLSIPPHEALVFADLEQTWPKLRSVYRGAFSNLVFGDLPSDSDVRETLARIRKRLVSVKWDISVVEQ